jgi:hypothetical protein
MEESVDGRMDNWMMVLMDKQAEGLANTEADG